MAVSRTMIASITMPIAAFLSRAQAWRWADENARSQISRRIARLRDVKLFRGLLFAFSRHFHAVLFSGYRCVIVLLGTGHTVDRPAQDYLQAWSADQSGNYYTRMLIDQ
jgi:hypothetical protein